MGDRTWSVRVGRPGMDVVLVVTQVEHLLVPIADRLAAAGYTGFVALPSAARELQRHTAFDIVVTESDVAWDAPTPEPGGLMHAIRQSIASSTKVD